MNTNWKLWVTIAGLSALLLTAIVSNRKPAVTPDLQLRYAADNLFMDAPEAKVMWERITTDYRVELRPGSLPLSVEGQTAVFQDHAVVIIDVNKVKRLRDRLEPVLAHELSHVEDARFKWGLERFSAQVDLDKNMPWEKRAVELSAVQHEDTFRKRLIASNPMRYTGMAVTRTEQNIRGSRFK